MALLTLAFAALISSSPATAAPSNRYAVLISANVGDPEEPALHYAAQDASRLAALLKDLGGFADNHVWTLNQPMPQDVLLTLAQIKNMVSAEGQPAADTMLLVYYAGHSDVQAMHLNHTRLTWPELIAATRLTGAGNRVLVVDACRSGTGGGATTTHLAHVVRREALGDLAIFSSVSADEQARESDAVGGALFTHHLLAALQGAGDVNGDGKVSLSEALHYSAARAVPGHELPAGGEERATQRFRLKNHGNVALTEPVSAPARGTLHLAAPGTYIIRQNGRDGGVATQAVVNSAVRTLWLPAGQYFVERRADHSSYEGLIQLAQEGGVMIAEDTLSGVSLQAATHVSTDRFESPTYAISVGGGLGAATAGQSVAPWLVQLLVARRHGSLVFDAEMHMSQGANGRGTLRDVSAALGARLVGSAGPLSLSAGLRGGVLMLDETAPGQAGRRAFAPHLDGVVRADVMFGDYVFAGVEGALRTALVTSNYFAPTGAPWVQPVGTVQVGVLF